MVWTFAIGHNTDRLQCNRQRDSGHQHREYRDIRPSCHTLKVNQTILTFFLEAALRLVLLHLLAGAAVRAAAPRVLAGHQRALAPVLQVVLQAAPLPGLRARVRVGANLQVNKIIR